VNRRLDPASPQDWHDYYEEAEKRRRRAGWHRRGPSKPKQRLSPTRVVAFAMGVGAVAVFVCLILPG
jgi:hypothetical protein